MKPALLPDQFAAFFNSKIDHIANMLSVKDGVYNGIRKIYQENKMFMDKVSIKECMLSLKIKNSEVFDRIPQRILLDGADVLIDAYEGLFSRMYAQVKVPAQWLISKTIPIFKNKGAASTVTV